MVNFTQLNRSVGGDEVVTEVRGLGLLESVCVSWLSWISRSDAAVEKTRSSAAHTTAVSTTALTHQGFSLTGTRWTRRFL